MNTSEVSFPQSHQYHLHLDHRKYSVDALIDIIRDNPRNVDQLDLTGWKTRKSLTEAGQVQLVLVSPTNIEHTLTTDQPRVNDPTPVLVCNRHGREVVVDGIDRVVGSLLSQQKTCPCVQVSYRELKRCLKSEA